LTLRSPQARPDDRRGSHSGRVSVAAPARAKIALPQNHRSPAVFIVGNGNAPLQMSEHRPFCSGMVGRRPLWGGWEHVSYDRVSCVRAGASCEPGKRPGIASSRRGL